MSNHEVWSAKQQSWLTLAKNGDRGACDNLFVSMKERLESVHRYSRDGLYPTEFGCSFNSNGRTFAEASSDVYEAFCNAVKRFDELLGVPFEAYAAGEIRRRAMDWVRSRQKDRLVTVGRRFDDEKGGDFHVLTQADYESSVNNYYVQKTCSLCDGETHPVECCEIEDMVTKIRVELQKNGDLRLVNFVEFFLEYAGEKKAMDMIAERMGVTRAMAYIYLNKVRSLVVPKFGAAA